jgi:hypothetical protein
MGLLSREQSKTVWHGFSNIFMSVTPKKKEIVILKLDFKKAFDKVEHHVILSMMLRKVFSQTWIQWIF